MLCNLCNNNEAVFHIKEVLNSKVKTLHLCGECAKQKGLEGDHLSLDLSTVISNLAAELLPDEPHTAAESGAAYDAPIDEGVSAVCDGCGMTDAEFKRIHRLGCAQCYEVFAAILEPRWEQMHRGTTHAGHTPDGEPGIATALERERGAHLSELQEELDRAVATEAYEEAAGIRDKIARLKTKP